MTFKKLKNYIKIIEKTKLNLTLFELLTCVYILAAKKEKKLLILNSSLMINFPE